MHCLNLKFNSCFFLFLFCLFSILEAKEECCLPMELRKKTLEQLDEWINRVTPLPVRTFPPIPSDITQVYQDPILELQTFSEDYGFFSCQKPLVGVVTEESSDIQIVEKALACLLMSNNPSFIELATGEILSKVLAYRGLQKGMIIRIPCIIEDKALLVDYEVAEILDLWLEMPAFGLLPLHKKANPILLFRGSDFSLISKKSWASLLSDLDVSGTGFSAFHLARTDIHAFLKKATLSSGNKTKVMGFSLGGILAMYTTIFEKPFIALQGSMAFNPPGFSKTISERWKEVSSLLKIYITQGDLIPKLGILAAPAFVLFTDQNFGPIEAHTLLMTAEPSFYLSEIHIENKLNKK